MVLLRLYSLAILEGVAEGPHSIRVIPQEPPGGGSAVSTLPQGPLKKKRTCRKWHAGLLLLLVSQLLLKESQESKVSIEITCKNLLQTMPPRKLYRSIDPQVNFGWWPLWGVAGSNDQCQFLSHVQEGFISAFKTVLGRGTSRSVAQLLLRMQENHRYKWQIGKVEEWQRDNPIAKSCKVVKKANILQAISVETIAISKDLFDSFEHLDCPLHHMTKVQSKSWGTHHQNQGAAEGPSRWWRHLDSSRGYLRLITK